MDVRTIVQVFLSSPSDCNAERNSITQAVNEMNKTVSSHSGIEVEVINWQDIYPGIDEYPQQVINNLKTKYID